MIAKRKAQLWILVIGWKRSNLAPRRKYSDWLYECWVPFYKTHYNSNKVVSSDRRAFSKMGARSSVYYQQIVENEKTGCKPVKAYKTFDNSKLRKFGFGTYLDLDDRKVPQNQQFDKLGNPTQELIDACYMNIKPGSNSKYLGKACKKIGKVPTIVRKPDIQMVEASHNVQPKYQKAIMPFDIITGGFNGLKKQLVRFSEGLRGYTENFNQRIANIDNFDKRMSVVKPLMTPKKVDIYFTPFRGESNPGGDFLYVAKNKFQNWFTACFAAAGLWEAIHFDFYPCVSTYSLSGKDKVSGWKDETEWVQSRMICQQDQVEFATAKPYVRAIELFIFNAIGKPIVVGKSLKGFRYFELLRKLTWYPFGIEFDWSGYDSTVNPEYIIAAFAWCRSLFEESEEIDKAFVYFCHGYLDKYIVSQDGNLFKLFRGTPSGSAWTTVINSVVNALLMEQIGSKYSAFAGKHFDYIVAGDDGVLFFDHVTKFSHNKLTAWVKRKVDMDLEIVATGSPISDDPDLSLSFNKKVLYWDGDSVKPTTQPKLLVKRLLPSSRPSGSFESLLNTVFGQYSDIITDNTGLDVIGTISQYLFKDLSLRRKYDCMAAVEMKNNKLYFTTQPEKLYLNDEYSVDKCHPLKDEIVFDSSINIWYVVNWLKDNTVHYWKAVVPKKERTKWLIAQMGPPICMSLLAKKLLVGRAPSFYGLNQKKIVEIFNLWNNYFDTPILQTQFVK